MGIYSTSAVAVPILATRCNNNSMKLNRADPQNNHLLYLSSDNNMFLKSCFFEKKVINEYFSISDKWSCD